MPSGSGGGGPAGFGAAGGVSLAPSGAAGSGATSGFGSTAAAFGAGAAADAGGAGAAGSGVGLAQAPEARAKQRRLVARMGETYRHRAPRANLAREARATLPALSRAIAWALNLEAEEELHRPGSSPSARRLARVAAMVPRVEGLVRPGDLVLPRPPPSGAARGHAGRAWCPTPGALAWLAASGAEIPPAPPLAVLQRVNHRRFSAELGQTLEGAIFTADRATIEARLATPSPTGYWLLKRPFGFSGAGRRRVRVGAVDPDLDRWITASLRDDGLQIEPWVARDLDVALHGHLDEAGALTVGRPTRQRCDAQGAWLATEALPRDGLRRSEICAIEHEIERTAEALVAAGYFGPFGIDAFRHEGGFNARCEINARYSMGWAVGMPSRPDLG